MPHDAAAAHRRHWHRPVVLMSTGGTGVDDNCIVTGGRLLSLAMQGRPVRRGRGRVAGPLAARERRSATRDDGVSSFGALGGDLAQSSASERGRLRV